MPKEAFGGDDDETPVEEQQQKPKLDKFNLAPDYNIRGLLWSILASYAATKKPGTDLKNFEHDRFALMRASISILSKPPAEYFGLSEKFVATYTLMMLMDGGWDDALREFLEEAAQIKGNFMRVVVLSMKKLLGSDPYGTMLKDTLKAMMRDKDMTSIAMDYVVAIGRPDLVRHLKTELIILARGDIGKTQLNAINAVSQLKEDADVRKTMIMLLSHWDSEARLEAATSLEKMGADQETREAVRKRAVTETDPEIKKILERIAK